jgi:hypothetical protein
MVALTFFTDWPARVAVHADQLTLPTDVAAGRRSPVNEG